MQAGLLTLVQSKLPQAVTVHEPCYSWIYAPVGMHLSTTRVCHADTVSPSWLQNPKTLHADMS